MQLLQIFIFHLVQGVSRNNRERYAAEIIPQILTNRQPSGCSGSDFNCIINKADATNNPEQKISPSLSRLVKVFDWSDSYRFLHPISPTFSRYYEARGVTGASRIDRQYHWGNIIPTEAEYLPLAFSDHLAHIVKVSVPDQLARMFSPRSRPLFKIKEEVARDILFQDNVKVAMEEWEQVKQAGLPLLSWWELIVKPGIRNIAMSRSKEINQGKKIHLNLLLLRQAYLVRKVHHQRNQWHSLLPELLEVQHRIQDWYKKAAEKVKHQSRVDEFQIEEKTRIYHHEIHKKHLQKSSILKLMTETGIIVGHEACANHLENMVADLLLQPAELDPQAQEVLLGELQPVVTAAENAMLGALPDKDEVFQSVKDSNLKAAPRPSSGEVQVPETW